MQESAKAAPRDRILLETDAPYLAPVPKRGKRNEPALMVHTARKLAELRGESLEEISRFTSENFQRLLNSVFVIRNRAVNFKISKEAPLFDLLN